ncbi:hypothetical protein ACI65C_006784, partial [Semiaphis heraclei]
MSGDKCVYFDCNLTRRSSKNIFHPFPANTELHKQWIVNSGNINLVGISPEKLRKKYICSNHFHSSMYMNSTSIKPRLIKNAIPKKYSI